MPSHKTFSIKPISELLKKYGAEGFVDPFPYPYEIDAIDYLKNLPNLRANGVLFDPPYSQRQLKEMYELNGLSLNHEMNSSYWRKCKTEIARITKPGGIVISFGWNSGGIGKKHGFEQIEILLVAHGGMHNDTICTVEKKIETSINIRD